MSTPLGTGFETKPRWDKRDPYVGNFRGVLAADVNLATQANRLLPCGLNASGAVVLGAPGQSGIIGVTIIPVGTDMQGHLLDGGVNTEAGDTVDVTKHGEVVNFRPTPLPGSNAVHITATSGTITPAVDGHAGSAFAYNGDAAALKTAIVAADDGLSASDVTVTGSGTDFTVVLPQGHTLSFDSGATVTPVSAVAQAGTKYYAHADGTIDANSASGVYIGHTAEADRLIVNVHDA